MLRDPELMQRPLGDGKLCDVLGRWSHREPSEALLWAAAELFEGGSPAMIQGAAQWLGVVDDLRDAGLDVGTIARVLLSAAAGEPEGWTPPGPVLAEVLAAAGDAIDPAAIAVALLAADERPRGYKVLFTICTALMAQGGEAIPESHDEHMILHVPWTHLRAIVQGLPAGRRDALLVRLIGTPGNANAARVQLRYVLPVLDLATGDGARASIEKARQHLVGDLHWADLLAKLDAGGGPPPTREGPTDECRKAVQYWLAKYEAQRKVNAIGEVARAAHVRAIVVDAPELASFDAWNATSDGRRTAIAEQVAAQLDGLALRGLERFEAGPIATFTQGELVFRLVPGGSYERGFSPEEEALVREAGEVARPADDNWFEEFGNFLDNQLPSMRPLTEVTVGPMLVSASPGYAMEPGVVTSFLGEMPWRLPSESEWEYLARGGRRRELTFRGHTVPDEAWFQQTDAARGDACNPFGLWGFGMQPEICSDGWHANYEGASADGTPRVVEGTTVVRGGAAMIYPWQQVGEWQLLCSAVRGPASQWEFEVSVRAVIGVSI